MVFSIHSHLDNIKTEGRQRCYVLEGGKMCAHFLGALCWNCTSTGFTVLCCHIWPHDTTFTKSGPPALPILVPPKKPLARMQPRVLLYPTQSASAAPLTAPNTEQVGWKSSTDFLFTFSSGWGRETSCKIIALCSKMQGSALCQKAEWWQGLSCLWKQLSQSHTATTCVRKYPPTPYPLNAELSLSIKKSHECAVPR